MTEVVLDAPGVDDRLTQMVDTIAGWRADCPLAVVGIRRGGEDLAHRIADALERKLGDRPPLVMVDITLYRDDGFGPHDWPEVGPTRIEFELKKYTVVLVDDVLYTGRTVRAAIDALLDYGRPKALRLAVLVDRGLRELPIRGDVVGLTLETGSDQHIDVQLSREPSSEDAVYMVEKGAAQEGEGT